MKNMLIAAGALVATTGIAAADVILSGQGRFGLVYDQARPAGEAGTQVGARLRFNIDATTITDGGVTFGGRIRMQWDNGDATSSLSPGKLYVSYEGLRVEVGNVDTAYDMMNLIYASEIGYTFRSFGDPSGAYYTFASKTFGVENDRMGVAAFYTMDDLTVRASYVTPDQTVTSLPAGRKGELGVSVDYLSGRLSLGAGYTANAAGLDGNDVWALTGQYQVDLDTQVGLLVLGNGSVFGTSRGRTVTLYGNTRFGDIGVAGYVAHNNAPANLRSGAAGIGVSYDLGGAFIRGAVHRGFGRNGGSDNYADLGVNFNF